MDIKNIATILNDTIVPNLLGSETTIAEDLSNIVDLGIALEDASAQDVMDYAGKFMLGVVRTYFNTYDISANTFGVGVDSLEYAGLVQRVRAGLLKAVKSNIVTLERGDSPVDYHDGSYYPLECEVKLYGKSVNWKIPYSISTNQFKTYFSSPEDVQKYVTLITKQAENTMNLELTGLARAVVNKLIVSQYSGGKVIKLITTYNTENGFTSGDDGFITINNFKQHPEFFHYCSKVITRLKSRIRNLSKNYNDGSIETVTSAEDVRILLLDEFATDNNFANIYAFNKEIVEFAGYSTIDYWQNQGTSILPSLGVTAEIVESPIDDEDDPVTISNVVGIVRDNSSAFITMKLNKISAEYVGAEDFTNYFHHMINSYTIDSSANAIVLTLE